MAGDAPSQDRTIAVRNLRVARGGRDVLRNVSLDVPEGRMTALVGPNGCGKSTLLKAIARLLPASSGEVALGGMPAATLTPRDLSRRLAMLPQAPVSPEGMRVGDLVAQGRHPYRGLLRHWSAADDAAVAAAMDAAGVAGLASRTLETLSGGQLQRAWIAMTLAQDTGIVLLDEPTTYLDLAVQIDIMRVLRRMAREGRTVLVVLHELNLAAAFADRMVLLHDGRIEAEGPPDAVMTETHLGATFGLDARVIPDPETGRPVCLPRTAAA